MKQKLFLIIFFIFILLITGCTTHKEPTLHGFYQSERINDYVIQISFDKEEHTFVEYISNIEINKGTYENLENHTYLLKGNNHDINITLEKANSFDVSINKLNGEEPIKLKKTDHLPIEFDSKFSDEQIEEIQNLLD